MGMHRKSFQETKVSDYRLLKEAVITVNGICRFHFVHRIGRHNGVILALYRCNHCGQEREFAIAPAGSVAA